MLLTGYPSFYHYLSSIILNHYLEKIPYQSSPIFTYSMNIDGVSLVSESLQEHEFLGSMPDRPYTTGMAYARFSIIIISRSIVRLN